MKKKKEDTAVCLVTGETLSKDEMIRFVVSPDGDLIADIHHKLPADDMWVTADRAVIEEAIEKDLFGENINIKQGIVDDIECFTLKKILQLVGLARKAGRTVAGEQKVIELTMKHPESLVIIAKEASQRQRQKVKQPDQEHIENILSAADLGRIYDREEIMYCAIRPGKMAKQLKADLKTYTKLRSET